MKPATVEERGESGKNLFKALMVCAEQSEDADEAAYLELATSMVDLAWQISRTGVSAAVAMNLLTQAEAEDAARR